MADHQVTAILHAAASTGARAGMHCSVGARIKRETPPELLPPPVKRLPSGEEVIVLRPYVRT